jgi:hypothetical protein
MLHVLIDSFVPGVMQQYLWKIGASIPGLGNGLFLNIESVNSAFRPHAVREKARVVAVACRRVYGYITGTQAGKNQFMCQLRGSG